MKSSNRKRMVLTRKSTVIALVLKELRLRKKMRQIDVSPFLKTSLSRYQKIENGYVAPTINDIFEIAEGALKVSVYVVIEMYEKVMHDLENCKDITFVIDKNISRKDDTLIHVPTYKLPVPLENIVALSRLPHKNTRRSFR